MRFLHLSDLHIGKRLAGFSLLDEQRKILFDAIEECKKHETHVIVLAGDIYDVATPSQSATTLLSDFLIACNENHIEVLAIPGNHDSAERLGFVSSLLNREGIHIVSTIEESLKPIEIEDARFFLFPFFKHFDINHAFGKEFETYEEAASYLLSLLELSKDKANVLVAHQTVLPRGKELKRSKSEDVVIGTIMNIDANLFKDFTYVALGHIHMEQQVADNAIYPGAIYKYDAAEANYEKNFHFVTVDKDGFRIEKVPIHFEKDVRVIEGLFDDIIHQAGSEDYVFLRLLDEALVESPMEKARRIFPNCCGVFSAKIEREMALENEDIIDEDLPPLELLKRFYLWSEGKELSDYQLSVAQEILEGEDEE